MASIRVRAHEARLKPLTVKVDWGSNRSPSPQTSFEDNLIRFLVSQRSSMEQTTSFSPPALSGEDRNPFSPMSWTKHFWTSLDWDGNYVSFYVCDGKYFRKDSKNKSNTKHNQVVHITSSSQSKVCMVR